MVRGVAGDRRTVRVELDIDVDCEPIEGRLTAGAASAREFIGWIALVHEIEGARDAAKAERTNAND
jgi:hypothetical protein